MGTLVPGLAPWGGSGTEEVPTLLGTEMDWACLVICIAIDAN